MQLAPHGKTHMSPQLAARQLAAGACAVTVATISQARTYRAFGVSALILANELVDAAGLRWLASELNADPDFDMLCWVDSVRGVGLMTDALSAAGLRRPLDVCVEVGAAGGRTGCRSEAEVDAVARAVVASRTCAWRVLPDTRRRSVTTSRRRAGSRSGTTCRRCGRRCCGWPMCSRPTTSW